MIIMAVAIKLYAPHSHSLKEKRMIVKSLISKIKNRFNVSIIESGSLNLHQSIEVAFALVAANSSLADSVADNVINFIENNADAQIISIEREAR